MLQITPELGTDQQALWDAQHAERGGQAGLEGDRLVDVANDAAVLLGGLLRPGSVIAEIGSANGRDARHWAQQGHTVYAMDFSSVALGQLVEHAGRQGVADKIVPIQFDANTGELPDEVGEIDGFYARSALHVDDNTLMRLLASIDRRLRPGGVVLIEGKTTDDPKIARSRDIGGGLAVDDHENGHVRRIWTHESVAEISRAFGWTAIDVGGQREEWLNTDASFLRFVANK